MKIGKILRGTAVSSAALLLTAGSVFAATTISANIATTGTLDVDGATTLDGSIGLGDAAADLLTVTGTIQGASPLTFEGSAADTFETTFAVTNPTADRTFTFPDASLTVAGTDLAQSWSAAQTFNGGITAATFSVNPATKDPIVIYPLTGSTGDFTGTITAVDLTGSNKTWTLPNATGTICLTSSCLSSSLTDNTASALSIVEGTNSYIDVTTSNGAEEISFGNVTTDPDFIFVGSGLFTTGDDIVINGNALTFGVDGTISSSGTANLTVDTASTGTLNLGTGASAKGVHIGNSTLDSEITMLSGTGAIRLNVDNNKPTNINTGTSSGAVSIGGGSGTVAVNSSDWDISTTGNMTGIGTISTDGQFTSTLSTGTAPFVVASTTPVTNLTASNHPKVQACGATTTCSATAAPNTQIVFGNVTLVGGTATVTGFSPAFTSTSSYVCTATASTAAGTTKAAQVTNLSGSSIQVDGTTTNSFNYICIGT